VHREPALRELLEREFPVDGVAFPWATELSTVEAAIVARLIATGRPPVTRPFGGPHNGFAVLATSVLGIPIVRQTVWAPSPQRPVVRVTFDLAPGQGLEGVSGLERIRPLFDAALVEEPERGFVATGKPNPYGVAAQWTSGSTEVHLWTTYEPRDFLDGTTRMWASGSLQFQRDETALLAPYLEAKLRPQPWEDATTGVLDAIAAPGLTTSAPGRNIERPLSVHADQYVTPRWVAERIGLRHVAIWTHPGAGVWGYGDACLSRVLPIEVAGEFVLTRIRPARNEGYAVLAPTVTGPGPAGLDEAAAALRGRGAQVRVIEAEAD
jgi:hypothetical protein